MSKDLKKICDPKTFEAIFNSYAKELRYFIFFKTQDSVVTEDILQESFIKLWNNCDNVDYKKVKSYLFTIANNLFLNEKKHEKVVWKHQQEYRHTIENESPEFVYLEKEFMKKIEKAIADLPEKQREVFLLNRIEKKKYTEIAKQLDISVKAVEKRMHLALMNLKDKIGKV